MSIRRYVDPYRMIRVPASDAIDLAHERIAHFASRHGKGVDFGDDENAKRDMIGARGELAFCKHLALRGIEHTHYRIGYGTPDVQMRNRGSDDNESHLVDVKSFGVFGRDGRPRTYIYSSRHVVERMIQESWFMVAAAVCGDYVWLSRCHQVHTAMFNSFTDSTPSSRPDDANRVRMRIDALDWRGVTWADVVREAGAVQ